MKTRTRTTGWKLAILTTIVLCQPAGAGAAQPAEVGDAVDIVDLTGVWHEPTGAYYGDVRQVGDEVWWVLRSGDGGKLFTAIFHGKLKGNSLKGSFVDVPPGKNQLHGKITAKVVVKDGEAVAIRGDVMFPPSDDGPRLLLHRGAPAGGPEPNRQASAP